MPAGGATWALTLTLSAFTADPRIPLVELQLAQNHAAALARVEAELAASPDAARRLGLEYLRGHLLLRLDRRADALQAFANTMGSTPLLGPYSRYRLAVEQEQAGHPEVAAGLVATLLGSNPPRPLIEPAVRMLRRTLENGGDCRLVRGLASARFPTSELRELQLAEAGCLLRGGDAPGALRRLLDLLEADRSDEVARLAAERVAERPPTERATRTELLVGMTFFDHREFDRALLHLERALGALPTAGISARETFDARYAVARSHFWESRFERAAAAFGALAAKEPAQRTQALYQQARSQELGGDHERAAQNFLALYESEPAGRFASSALFGYLRLQWVLGREPAALQAYDALVAGRRSTTARASIFLAVSDLVAGRADRAGVWLNNAVGAEDVSLRELGYWRGRLEETRGRLDKALDLYLGVLRDDPYHPLAQAVRRRLSEPAMARLARATGERLAGSANGQELYAAWLLLGSQDPTGKTARQTLERQIAADRATAPFLDLRPAPAAGWPLWQATLTQPEEMLLALGLWNEGASSVTRHFPIAQPALAFTASQLLGQAGNVNRSLYVAEVLRKRVPSRLPGPLLPAVYRRLLFPFHYSYPILRETNQRGVDPFLLAAVIREESRFDPRAFSAASARGLTQFVLPTARRVATAIGLGELDPEDLHRPEVSIALGAAYLGELETLFGGKIAPTVAAYNAGEPQAELWQRYCKTDEPEEYLAKIAFKETRAYVVKVLTSQANYTELYRAEAERVP